jgi:hypothetical protein
MGCPLSNLKAGRRAGLLLVLAWYTVACGQENLLPNGGFESGSSGQPDGWSSLWAREPGKATCSLDQTVFHSGSQSLKVEHSGREDWSLGAGPRLAVKPGDLFRLEAWARFAGSGSSAVGVVAFDGDNHALNWFYAAGQAPRTPEWRRVQVTFAAGPAVATLQPRITGQGEGTAWWDDVSLVCTGNALVGRTPPTEPNITISSKSLSMSLDTRSLAMTVKDLRTGQQWVQGRDAAGMMTLEVVRRDAEVSASWMDPRSARILQGTWRLEPNLAELTLTLTGKGELTQPLAFPPAFVTSPGTTLVIPMNEGISVPVDDSTFDTPRLVAYGGHGICMAFWAVTDGQASQMAIIETPDDAAIRLQRSADRLCVQPEWDAQKGQFGYDRRLRYVFLDRGGYVAVCKRYRAYAKEHGLVKTLSQKRQEIEAVDLLVGAVNVWNWDMDPVQIVRNMKALGMDRILWSRASSTAAVTSLNQMGGVLTSRYDIYQDLMDPKLVEQKVVSLHPDWTQAGWPNDLMLDENGQPRSGWEVSGKDGRVHPCAVLCDRQAVNHAKDRVPADLETHPYRCRFIDTTTASPWRECYDPRHPMTRTDSRVCKMDLLRYMSERMHLVTGSETGHDAAVPFVHYFEGMLSLGPFRVPDAGRNMLRPWTEVPVGVERYQLGHRYRLPLWELVYHDCVVAQWYWGDYNNKLPSLWDKRDLFNILYGTPPMFMFDQATWAANDHRFSRSYSSICPIARAVGYSEMVDHRFLTPDKDVQQTTFGNGVVVTVNFGSTPFAAADGISVQPMGYRWTQRQASGGR